MVTVRIDPKSGLLADSGQPDAVFETFRKEYVPRQHAVTLPESGGEAEGSEMEELF